ncbi:MAG: 50S ribosomal protein L22 [Bacteroidales bacterium]|jgi:large subunit ribosomal protein L22|nr:50S ribosomal protein L22 [Bacteroidales bacterium]MDD3664745.1 50S ribosomal protein L22 [Bacteroidales bacterium]
MGSKKHIRAEATKEAKKGLYIARLNNCPTSPRKMRLVADMIRGVDVERGLGILKFSTKHASIVMRKLLLSAMANWQVKNEGARIEEAELYVQEIMVDGGRMLKRIHTAPQGRAYRVRKRSNHITLILGNRKELNEANN